MGLMGSYLGSANENPDETYHNAFGVWPDIGSTYYQGEGVGGSTISPYETDRINRGTTPLLTVTSTNGPYSMAQIGSGSADSWIDYWGNALAGLPGEVWFTFDHEFEVKVNQSEFPGTQPTAAEYATAFNRFMSRVKALASNVRFVYWYGYSDTAAIEDVGSRIDRPDMFALDPYVWSWDPPSQTFEQMCDPVLSWLRGRTWFDGQPIIFGEYAKDTRLGVSECVAYCTDLRQKMDTQGLLGGLWFFRDNAGSSINGYILDDPQIAAAYGESARTTEEESMGVTFVGQTAEGEYTQTLVVEHASTTGNTLVLSVCHSTDPVTPTVSDTAGNTWTLAATTADSSATGQRLSSMFYCVDADAVTSVTVTRSDTQALLVNLTEWSGVQGLNATVSDLVTANPATLPVTATDGYLIIGSISGYHPDSETVTVGAPYTQLTTPPSSAAAYLHAGYLIGGNGSTGPAFTNSATARQAGMITAAFTPVPVTTPDVHLFDGTNWIPQEVSVFDGTTWVPQTVTIL